MSKSKLGLVLIVVGIASAIIGTIFYQNALAGVIQTINAGYSYTDLIFNMHYTALMVVGGIISLIIGLRLTIPK